MPHYYLTERNYLVTASLKMQCNMGTTLCSLFQLGKEGWQLSSFRMVCTEALQVPTLGLIHLDGLEEGLEVASTETLRRKHVVFTCAQYFSLGCVRTHQHQDL